MTQRLDEVIQRKISRLRDAQAPIRTIDLFAGAGGFSLGFDAAGYELIAAVENNIYAQRTHIHNFQSRTPHYSMFGDITVIHPEEVVAKYLETRPDETPESVVDVIIGGPPCQPFSLSGRAKLRQVANDPSAFENDRRVTLYTRYLAFVERLRPLAFVMENVLGIGNHKKQNIPEAIAEEVRPLGYVVKYALLNAAWYGVPQMRERMIVIGIHEGLGIEPSFPEPTHHLTIPVGYATSRTEKGKAPVRKPHPNWVVVKSVGNAPAVTVKEALDDLPPITYHLQAGAKVRGARRFGELAKYREGEPSEYARTMRQWEGFSSTEGVFDHVMRHTPRDYETFRRMPHGAQYPLAKKIAIERFQTEIERLAVSGKVLLPGHPDYEKLYDAIVPPYDENKYPNKWRKMEPDMPARTLPAHLAKDTYSHIHYDSDQARMITVREAARLQSFPDGFTFPVSMIEAFRQIGNAVPPLMAKAIGVKLRQLLLGGEPR